MKSAIIIPMLLCLSVHAATITSVLTNNPTYPNHFIDSGTGKAVLLTGPQTWTSFQDLSESSTPAAISFDNYVNFLSNHNASATILWKKDLPKYFAWGADSGSSTWYVTPWPWNRTGPGNATDGNLKFDLTTSNNTYYARLRNRVIQLQTNGIYAIVELFDGLGINGNRGSTDGYPYTGANNINSVDDGYSSGATGISSMTMGSANAITGAMDAYVTNVLADLSDLPNVLWEISEEAPDNSTWWQGHMIVLIHSREASAGGLIHPVGYPTLNVSGATDSTLYNSDADWVAPVARFSPTSSCGSGTPACKVNINDSDHSYFGMWNDSAQYNRGFCWTNVCNNDAILFMDPYLIYWPSGSRNSPGSVSNGVGTTEDSRWNNFRDNMGYAVTLSKQIHNFAKMVAQSGLASTGNCLAYTNVGSWESLVYAYSGGSFTVNLATQTGRTLNVQWLNPATGTVTNTASVSGGSSSQSFSTPSGFAADSVLLLQDSIFGEPPAAVSAGSGVYFGRGAKTL